METTILTYIGSIGGVAGVLAYIIFCMYRSLVKQALEDRKFMEDRLTKIIESYNEQSVNNTQVLTELIVWLKAKNGGKRCQISN
jgi:predicted nucleic acid-binding protein